MKRKCGASVNTARMPMRACLLTERSPECFLDAQRTTELLRGDRLMAGGPWRWSLALTVYYQSRILVSCFLWFVFYGLCVLGV